MKRFGFVQHFNWRILLLRVLVNAGALLITAGIVPHIYFVDRRLFVVLWMAIVLGVLNALVKPVVQFLTLPFVFATYGVVIVLINAGLLWLLSVLFPSLFEVDGLAWALLGGLVMGLLGSLLEGLLGVTPPIVPEKYGAVRQQLSRRLQPVPSALAQAAAPGAVPAAVAVSAEAAPAGAPPSLDPSAAGIEGPSEPLPSDEPASAAAGVDATWGAGSGEPVPDTTGSEG